MSKDRLKGQKLKPGTWRRVLAYAAPYRGLIVVFLSLSLATSALVVATPLILKHIVDDAIPRGDTGLIVQLSLLAGGLALLDLAIAILGRKASARIGENLILDLRRQVFSHVLAQPIAFFTRTQTGALVNRVNSDVVGAQQAFTSVLGSLVSNVITVVILLGTMGALSWPLTLASVALLPVFLVPAHLVGRRMAGLTREAMALRADMGTRMTERFDVAGALLVKLFGDPAREEAEYGARASAVADIGVQIATNRVVFMAGLTFIASLATAVVYGVGGVWAAEGALSVGTLLAMTALLARLYQPLTALSNVRVDVMTALVSFERVFEILDLPPMITERPDARDLPAGPLSVDLDHVSFSYPGADEISLTSLESATTGDRERGDLVLRDVSIHAEPGELVALVGPSGAGKTTVTTLLARLYDPDSGQVRLGGLDARDVTFASLRNAVGVVTQDAHMFHDTIRGNLAYARPDASEADIEAALRAAQVWDLVERLPQGLETVVGDRGHRLSGGEKQRLAIARLLLRSPGLVVLDEATAHLDSESEVAVQRALDAALHGRTAVVIAHRLSTVRGADRIVVLESGRVVETGTHAELLAAGGLYADLYRTQFADG